MSVRGRGKGSRCVPPLGLVMAAVLAAWPAPALGGGYPYDTPAADPASGRLVYTQTAFSQPKGSFDFHAVDAYQFFFSYGITDNFSLSVTTVPPIYWWGMGVFPKVTFRLAPGVRLGFVINAGFFYPFFLDGSEEDIDDYTEHNLWFLYGGAPFILTIGDENKFLNLSLHLGGLEYLRWGRDGGEKYRWNERHSYFFPSFGGGFRVAPHVKINFQIWTVLSAGYEGREGFNGRVWGLMPGFRFHGKKFYLDAVLIVFLMPLLDIDQGGIEEVEQPPPLFAPMVIFGVRI